MERGEEQALLTAPLLLRGGPEPLTLKVERYRLTLWLKPLWDLKRLWGEQAELREREGVIRREEVDRAIGAEREGRPVLAEICACEAHQAGGLIEAARGALNREVQGAF